MSTATMAQALAFALNGDVMSRSRFLFILVVFLLLGSAGVAGPGQAQAERSWPGAYTMRLGGHAISVEIASTGKERARGLSGRKEMSADTGLLFVFPSDDLYGIWMREMNFAIDIVWISQDLRVVFVASDVAPETFPEVFRPVEPARYVVEMRAGSARTLGITAGTTVTLPSVLAN